ncbi:MAG: SusC/RagA family TonB-linked outer membrane protein [Ekhidna sp.]
MKRILLLSFAFLTVVAFGAMAQRTVSGKVTDDTGESLPGVNVVIKGTTTGTTTDLDGNYRLSVDDGATLTFSFVGFESQEVEVGARTTIDISMGGATELQEVVVTAQGIQREKRALGYAVSSVDSDALERRPNNDVAQLLNGKVAGVNITQTSGTAGAGMNIIIRGYTSIGQSNQPLFIVDGVPFNTNTNADSGFTGGSLNSSSRFLDIDPNNIAGIEVLKGLSATVLYGEQGRNGVILITTKAGAAGRSKEAMSVTLTQGVFASKIASLPDYQDQYGNGFHQFPAFFFSNWGDDVSNVETVPHPYSQFRDPALLAAFPEFAGVDYEYKAYDNAPAFFETGITSQTSLGLSASNGKTSVNSTISYVTEDGFMPNNNLEKINFGIGLDSKLGERLTLNTTMNLALTETSAPPLGASTGSSASGNGSAFYANILYTPTTVDLNGLPFENPLTGASVYYRGGNDIPNPNWLAEYTRFSSDVSRVSSKTSLTYDILDNLSVTYRGGYDTYYEFQEYVINKGIGPGPANTALNAGLYRTTHIRNSIWDHTGLINYNANLNQDLNLGVLVGVNARLDNFERDGLESTGQNAFGFIEHGNFTTTSSINSFQGTDIQTRRQQNLYAVYTSVNLDFRDFLYLNLQARNDWSSTIEKDNQSILYPSASLSFIPTTAFEGLESDMLNYIKLRVGFGTSAGFPNPYQTRNTLAAVSQALIDNAGNTISTNATSNRLGNPNLKAETHQELELGLEVKAFNNRVGLDLSIYNKTTKDLIQRANLDPSTGYTVTDINAGEIENKGIELGLNVTPIRSGDLTWDLNFNYFAYESTVVELAPEFGLDFIQTTGFTDFAGNAMIPGEPFGALWGTLTQRDPDGNKIVDSNGDYLPSDEPGIIGDPNPDFNLNGISTLTWKGLTFGMQWEYRHGGDIFSISGAALPGRGLTQDVDFDREPPIILPGVKQTGTDGDGNPVYAPNDIMITTTDAFFNNLGFGQTEDRVWDGTTIRLREISLGYDLPAVVMDKLPFAGISVSAVASNMFFKAVNFPEHVNFDTDVLGTGVGNGLGLDFLSGPSAKRFGGTIKITF